MRPCPLFSTRAVLTSGSGDSTGGKSCGRVQQRGDLLLERRLIVFHMQNVIRPAFGQGFRDLRLAEDRIARDDLTRHRNDPQESQRGLMFVGFGPDADLTDDRSDVRREQSQQVYGGRIAIVRAAQGFAIQGQVLAQVGAPLENPVPQDGFERVDVESPEDAGVGCHTGGFAAPEPEGLGQRESVIAPELSDPLEGRSSGEDTDDGERENGTQLVDEAPGLTGIQDTIEHLDQSEGHDRTSQGKEATYPFLQLSPTSTEK